MIDIFVDTEILGFSSYMQNYFSYNMGIINLWIVLPLKNMKLYVLQMKMIIAP